jgi:hypothetical protein
MPRARFVLALAAAALVAAGPRPAAACSCTNELTLQQEFDGAWVVFSGRVLEINADPFGTLAVRMDPIQRWKGSLAPGQIVVTPVNEAVCGFPFVVGEEYLVFGLYYAYGITYTPTPYTHLCSKSGLLADNPYLAQLPPPLLPTPAARPTWGALKIGYR